MVRIRPAGTADSVELGQQLVGGAEREGVLNDLLDLLAVRGLFGV